MHPGQALIDKNNEFDKKARKVILIIAGIFLIALGLILRFMWIPENSGY